MGKYMRTAVMRIGIAILVIWVIVILIGHPYGFIVAGVLTALGVGILGWQYFYLRKNQAISSIVQSADLTTAEGRKEAMSKLAEKAPKGEAAAQFAKAQLLMHEDPRKALEQLEQIDLSKTMPVIADQARGQRAMIHLIFGEVDRGRTLVDAIDLSRHEDIKQRAGLAGIVAEAWARSGQAKRANEILDLFNPENPELEELRPQLYRSRAFATAVSCDVKRMRHALRKLKSINPQLLAGFVQKKIHPILEKEARQMLMQSGAVPKKMVRQRM